MPRLVEIAGGAVPSRAAQGVRQLLEPPVRFATAEATRGNAGRRIKGIPDRTGSAPCPAAMSASGVGHPTCGSMLTAAKCFGSVRVAGHKGGGGGFARFCIPARVVTRFFSRSSGYPRQYRSLIRAPARPRGRRQCRLCAAVGGVHTCRFSARVRGLCVLGCRSDRTGSPRGRRRPPARFESA